MRLGDYVKIRTGKLDANASSENGQYPFFTCSVTPLKIDTYSYDCECVLVAGNGDLNVKYYNGKFDAYQRTYIIESKDKEVLSVPYLYCFLDKYVETLRRQAIGGVIKYIKLGNLTEANITIPSLDEQREIVKVLNKVDDIIQNRQRQIGKLDELVKAKFIEMFGDKEFPTYKWNDVFNTTTGKLDSNAMVEDGPYPFFTCAKEVFKIDKYAFDQEALLLAGNNAAGKYDVKYYKGKFNAYQRTYVLSLKQDWSYKLFKHQLEDKLTYLQEQSKGSNTRYITLKILGDLKFTVPPIELQNQFAVFVEKVEKSKQEIQNGLDKLELMKNALMQKYFG